MRNLIGGFWLFNVLWTIFLYWVGFSLVTSGIKAVTGNCGTRYGIERVVAGNWFCPS